MYEGVGPALPTSSRAAVTLEVRGAAAPEVSAHR